MSDFHDRRLARRMQDTVFRETFERETRERASDTNPDDIVATAEQFMRERGWDGKEDHVDWMLKEVARIARDWQE